MVAHAAGLVREPRAWVRSGRDRRARSEDTHLATHADGQDIVAAIHETHDGKVRLDPNIAGKVLTEFSRLDRTPIKAKTDDPILETLTERELSILNLMAEGKTNAQIAEVLFLAAGTVKNNVSNIIGKLHANDRTQAVLAALRKGIVDL